MNVYQFESCQYKSIALNLPLEFYVFISVGIKRCEISNTIKKFAVFELSGNILENIRERG